MENIPKLLEVGMYIYNYRNYGGLNRHKVTRVTPKQAEAEGIIVKREIIIDKPFYDDKERYVVKKVGDYGNCYLQTPELLNEWREYNTLNKAKRLHRDFKVDNITVEQAKKLIELYQSIQPEEIKS